jgi:hypothetical protein
MPAGVQAFCTLFLLGIELVVPVLIFAGRRACLVAAGLFVLLQVLILLTGNYTFFNFLTILLCVPLLDDDVLKLPRPESMVVKIPPFTVRCARWSRLVLAPLSFVIVLVTSMKLLYTMHVPEHWPASAAAISTWLQPLRSFNNYGLFAVMTQKRPEIIVEGSDDGRAWQAYEFKYKPGDLKAGPRFVAPFQPRLDWQMWFAALESPQDNQWFINFEFRLLQNSPEVLALLARNPFPKAPPKYIRALLYEYHFTDLATRRATGQWWRREYKGVYLPPVSLPENERGVEPGHRSADNREELKLAKLARL